MVLLILDSRQEGEAIWPYPYCWPTIPGSSEKQYVAVSRANPRLLLSERLSISPMQYIWPNSYVRKCLHQRDIRSAVNTRSLDSRDCEPAPLTFSRNSRRSSIGANTLTNRYPQRVPVRKIEYKPGLGLIWKGSSARFGPQAPSTASFRDRARTRAPMLLDISPLCLYHNQLMILTQETLHPRRFLEETYRWFACPVYGCNQRYDTARGYYVIRDGAFEDGANKGPCTDCSHFLYLAKRGSTMEDTDWLCANEECPSNTRKR